MRKRERLMSGWFFTGPDKTEIPVTLPHTWNAVDGQDGGNDYHRGTCWYVRELSKEECAGERLFLELCGAAMTCEVYLNGEKLCRHEGGYSTFRVELTGHLAEKNVLAVSVRMSVNRALPSAEAVIS